jgi:hypothetical protein
MAHTQIEVLMPASIRPSDFCESAHDFLRTGAAIRLTKTHRVGSPAVLCWMVWCPSPLTATVLGRFRFTLDLGAPEPWHP